MSDVHHIGVVGGGAWGTALACLARRATRRVTLWSRDPAISASIVHKRTNPVYLPGQVLEPGIEIAFALASLEACDAILLACPAQAVRTVAAGLPGTSPVVICSKGIETATGLLMPEVLAEVMPNRPFAILSGPSFAEEAVQGLPTAVSIATADPSLGRDLAAALAAGMFRPYWTDDVTGVSLGGAIKNVLAIAAGIVEGAGLGDNARAAMITRGLAEMIRLGNALGARPETLSGLAGMGDLVLTCTGASSRNHRLGVALGKGQTVAEATAGSRAVVEGVASARPVRARAKRLGVEMPLVEAVDDVVNAGLSVKDAVQRLLGRPPKAEGWH